MFARLVGKHQVGNLLLAALKGTFTQRLGADFELAARVARMVDSNASYKWQMGNEIFFCFWSVFPLMSSAACCLTGVLLTVLPRLLLSAAVGAGERSWAAWHPRALRAATHSATFLGPYGPVSQQALLSRSRHKHFFCFFFFSFIGANAEVALGMLSLFEGVDERAAHGDFKGNRQHFKNTRRLS